MSSGRSGEQAPASQQAGTSTFVHAPRTLGGMVASTVGYTSRDATPQLHRGLPSPYLTLIFSLDGPLVCGTSPEHARGRDAYRAEVVVGGLSQEPVYIAQPSCETGVQLAVHPLAARVLLGMPAGELTDVAGDGAAVLGASALETHERLREQDSWSERFETVSACLRRRYENAGRRAEVRPELMAAWKWMAWHQGTGSLDGMAQHVAMSRRQLTTLFRQEVGASPKQISRLMRFERAQRQLKKAVADGLPWDLSRLAVHCGFYDHSHLVRDFQQFTGLSPSAWIEEEHRNIQAWDGPDGEEWDA